MFSDKQIIEQTEKWINDVVIACNFCPFAANVVRQQTIHYHVETGTDTHVCLETLMLQALKLDNEITIETILVIFPNAFHQFDDYLDLVALAEKALIQNGYEGIYQLASFHPLYQFEGSTETDAANYTNRSVYPMLHLLRESSIDKALEHYKNPENIPDRNIDFAKKKGLNYMKMLRNSCLGI